MRPLPALLAALLFGTSPISQAQEASAQPSQNITLLSSQNLHSSYTGSCAYIHSDGREYVAVGALQGTAIVRLTDPANPVEVAFIPGSNAGIREPEQYQSYLYVVGSGSGPGIQVISMADPDHPVLVNTVTTTTDAENVTIDTVRGYLYTTGSFPRTGDPGLHIYSLADPVNPVRIGTYESYQVHDLTVKGTRGYACDQFLNVVHVLDLTNPATPIEVATFSSAIGTTHTAIPTADDRYLIVCDESFTGTIGRPLVYDIQDLSRISLVFSFDDLPDAMPHFPVIRGDLLYVAHYTAGVHVYDIADPLRPVKVAYYDTWPGDDRIFAGVYEAPASYPSGIFTATDRGTGLYVFRVDPAYGLVRGTVRIGNKALSGATVRVLPDGPSFVTGVTGYYGLAPASGGSVTLECSKFGYVTQTASIAVTTGSQQARDFTLAALGTGTLKGTVRRAADQAVLAGASVSLEGSPLASTTSGMGKYTFMKVPEGSYTMRAEVLQLAPSFASISLTPHATLTTDFALVAAPFFDDGEADLGWTLGEPDDDAVAGRWVRAAPIGTSQTGNTPQPPDDHSPAPGTVCFVTGNAPAGSPPTQESLRGGKTTLTSPSLDLSAIADPRISYWLWFYNTHQIAAPNGSTVTTQLSNDGGTSWIPVSTFMLARSPWVKIELRVQDYIPAPSNAVRVRFIAENRISGTVEVLIDDFKVFAGPSGAARVTLAAAGLSAVPRDALLRVQSRAAVPSRGAGSWAISLSRPAAVRADLFDVQGRRVRRIADGALLAGDHVLRWDGRTATGGTAGSGVYWIRIQAEGERRILKFVLTR